LGETQSQAEESIEYVSEDTVGRLPALFASRGVNGSRPPSATGLRSSAWKRVVRSRFLLRNSTSSSKRRRHVGARRGDGAINWAAPKRAYVVNDSQAAIVVRTDLWSTFATRCRPRQILGVAHAEHRREFRNRCLPPRFRVTSRYVDVARGFDEIRDATSAITVDDLYLGTTDTPKEFDGARHNDGRRIDYLTEVTKLSRVAVCAPSSRPMYHSATLRLRAGGARLRRVVGARGRFDRRNLA